VWFSEDYDVTDNSSLIAQHCSFASPDCEFIRRSLLVLLSFGFGLVRGAFALLAAGLSRRATTFLFINIMEGRVQLPVFSST